MKIHTHCHAEELTGDTQETNSQNRPQRNAFPLLLSLKTLLQHTRRYTSWNCLHALLSGTHGTVSMLYSQVHIMELYPCFTLRYTSWNCIHALLSGICHGTVSMLYSQAHIMELYHALLAGTHHGTVFMLYSQAHIMELYHALLAGTHHGTVFMLYSQAHVMELCPCFTHRHSSWNGFHALLSGTRHGTVSMLLARYSLFAQNSFCYVTDQMNTDQSTLPPPPPTPQPPPFFDCSQDTGASSRCCLGRAST